MKLVCETCNSSVVRVGDQIVRKCGHDGAGVIAGLSAHATAVSCASVASAKGSKPSGILKPSRA